MNLDALLKPGALPWSPNQDVSGLDAWNGYDHPLTGTFVCDAETVLFTILSDFEGQMSLWTYTCLTKKEQQDLAERQFESVPEMREFVRVFFEGRRLAFSLAADNKIKQWSVPDKRGPLLELAIAFLNDVLTTEHPGDQDTTIRIKLAQAATAEAVLVDA